MTKREMVEGVIGGLAVLALFAELIALAAIFS